MDMIDGGGMGASGSEFQGGGLLSDIGNALFQPAGYREQQRAMAETRPQMRPMAMEPVQPMPMPTRPQARPDMASGMTTAPTQPNMPQVNGNEPFVASQQSLDQQSQAYSNAFPPPVQYDDNGTVGMPMPQFAQTPKDQELIKYLRSIGAIDY